MSGRSASTPPRQKHGWRGRSSSPPPTTRNTPTCSSAGQRPPTRPAAHARPPRRSSRHSTGARARGDTETQARALIQLSPVRPTSSARAASSRLAHEAVSLLEQAEPGANHVAAYSQLAGAQHLAGAYAETIATAEQALLAGRAAGAGSAGPGARHPRPRPRLPGRCRRPCRGGAGARPAGRTGGGSGRGPSSRTTSPSPATRSRARPAPSRSFEEGLAFSEQRGLAGEAVFSRATAPVCWSSSAALRKRSSAPPGSPSRPRRAATRSRCASCGRSNSPPASPKASANPHRPPPTG